MTKDDDSTSANSAFELGRDDLLRLFEHGEMEIEGRMPYSSNATLLVQVRLEELEHRAIYKPAQGERPLWDFPDGLYKREAAMFRLADQLGWDVIPPTTVVDGPFGEGSVQAFVNGDFSEHYFTLMEAGVGRGDLERLCVLDLIGNNTDRKSGHCILGVDGRVYGIDHGLAFHAQFKLRTVMWDFVGDPIPADIVAAVDQFVTRGPRTDLAELLDRFEVDAMMARAKAILKAPYFPTDDTDGRRYPWPLV